MAECGVAESVAACSFAVRCVAAGAVAALSIAASLACGVLNATSNALQELVAIEPRHHHVGHDEVEGAVGGFECAERLHAIGRLLHPEPPGREHAPRGLAQGGVVVDDEHSGVQRRAPLWQAPRILPHPLIAHREQDRERGAGADLARHLQGAPGVLHDPKAGRQPEPRSLSNGLGGEVRLEDAVHRRAIHSVAFVGHDDSHAAPRGVPSLLLSGMGHREDETPAVRHRVPCVHSKIEEHLIAQSRVHAHDGGPRARVHHDLDAITDGAAQHLGDVRDAFVEVHRTRLSRLLA